MWLSVLAVANSHYLPHVMSGFSLFQKCLQSLKNFSSRLHLFYIVLMCTFCGVLYVFCNVLVSTLCYVFHV